MLCKIKCFLFMNENYIHCHHQTTAWTLLYNTTSKKITKRFYIQESRHTKKMDLISITFLYSKALRFLIKIMKCKKPDTS